MLRFRLAQGDEYLEASIATAAKSNVATLLEMGGRLQPYAVLEMVDERK